MAALTGEEISFHILGEQQLFKGIMTNLCIWQHESTFTFINNIFFTFWHLQTFTFQNDNVHVPITALIHIQNFDLIIVLESHAKDITF